MNDNSDQKSKTPEPRKRSLTELTLGWFAERLRKADAIKEKLETGAYAVDSRKVAASIVSKDQH